MGGIGEEMIKDVWLFTSGAVMIFDQDGNQMYDHQVNMFHTYSRGPVVARIFDDHPTIRIARWFNTDCGDNPIQWAHEISVDEFAHIVGCADVLERKKKGVKS